MNLYSIAAIREMDRMAIAELGLSGYALMTRAAEAAFAAIRQYFPGSTRWQIVCGAGNNAGDGYVLARLAIQAGMHVAVSALIDPDRLTGDAARAHEDFAAAGQRVDHYNGELDDVTDLIVDALLGSGLTRDLSGEFANAVASVNAHGAPVVSLDLPSGLDGDSGEIHGCAIKADLTVTFAGMKAGFFLGAGPELVGRIVYDDLGLPEECRSARMPAYRTIADDDLVKLLPRRARMAHKGDFGRVLVIGGGPGMSGAARLCGEAALRAGAGRVTVAAHSQSVASIAAGCPELMSHGITDADEILPLLDKADVVAFGPGLGQSDWARSIHRRVATSTLPCVWDADALNLLARAGGDMAQRIITPHPGEAARLLNISGAAVQADRPAALLKLRARFGGVVVLKGAGTLISSDTSTPWLCTAGNPGMATAGMGDVLTGIIAALIAAQPDRVASIEGAALAGVEIHARAGDIAARVGQRGLIASDVIRALRQVVNP